MMNNPTEISLHDVTHELQNLEKELKSTENIIESHNKWSDLRKNVLEKFIQFVVENPSKHCKKLMDFVWKKIFYVQISKLRPLLDFNSQKMLSTTSSRRELYERVFTQMIEEYLSFYRKFEENITLKRDSHNNEVDVYLREAQVVCNICSGDLYRYVYNFKGTIVDSDAAIIHYQRAFLVDPNNDSSHNQLGILYKNDGNYFMSMFYFIKGCLNTEDNSTMIYKNKDITYNLVQNLYKSLHQMNDIQDKDHLSFKYGVILLVCHWLNLSTSSSDKNLLNDMKVLHGMIADDSLKKIQYLKIEDFNSIMKNNSIQTHMLYVCVLFIFALEKLRKSDSSTFREALELFIDIMYACTKYSVNMIERIYMLNYQKQKESMSAFLSDDYGDENDDGDIDENGFQYKNGYLAARRATRNYSTINNDHLHESESDLSENDNSHNSSSIDNHHHNLQKTDYHYIGGKPSYSMDINRKNNEIIVPIALEHCCLNILKIIIDWLTRSIHVIPVINEITNDNILKHFKKNIKRIRDVINYFGIDDESSNFDILKEIFPEDILVLDHHLFVDSKFRSWTDFDLFKKFHEYTILRTQFLCYLISSHKLFKKDGFDDLMKSLEYIPSSDIIAPSNVIISSNRRNQHNSNRTTNSKSGSKYTEKRGVKSNSSSQKFQIIRKELDNNSSSVNDIIPIKTPSICIIEYGTLRNSLYLVRKILNNQSVTVIIPKSCVKKIDYHKKNCPKVRESAKFIESIIASGNNLLQLQADNYFTPIETKDITLNNKFYIPLIECALYYRKHTLPSIDINIALSYHDYKKLKQNEELCNYLHKILILQNINYINIENIVRKR